MKSIVVYLGLEYSRANFELQHDGWADGDDFGSAGDGTAEPYQSELAVLCDVVFGSDRDYLDAVRSANAWRHDGG